MLFSSLEAGVCYAARQPGLVAALRMLYLNNLFRLLRRRSCRGSDIDVDVVAGVCHIGIHGGGGVSGMRGVGDVHSNCAGW
jgi:hypothetical protein